MTDLLKDVKELEDAIAHSTQVADSYNDTAPDCDCAEEHRQLSEWLTELLEIKKARLSVEVFFEQSYSLLPDEEQDDEDGPLRCVNCKRASLTQKGPKIICSNCGRVQPRNDHE